MLMFGEINQIGLAFRDISQKIEQFKEIFGISQIDTIDVKIKRNIYKEKIEPIKLRLGMATVDKIQFEFIQPLEGKTIYDPFLEKKGGGIHHLATFVGNLEEKIKEIESRGIKQLSNGIVVGIRFAYFDTTDLLGYFLEFVEVKTKS